MNINIRMVTLQAYFVYLFLILSTNNVTSTHTGTLLVPKQNVQTKEETDFSSIRKSCLERAAQINRRTGDLKSQYFMVRVFCLACVC